MSETRRRAAVSFIFVTVLLDMVALGIIVPVLPRLVVDFLHGDTARAAETLGLFTAAWALMQLGSERQTRACLSGARPASAS
jgi:MFS transporter, DHA1 family, tetracycline resistance protein